MNQGTHSGFSNIRFPSNNEWSRPPPNFSNQQISYPIVGWDYNPRPVCPDAGSSGHGLQNHYSGWNNNQGSWNNNQGSWNNNQGSWNNNQGSWNNNQSSWNNNQSSWNNSNNNNNNNQGPWNISNNNNNNNQGPWNMGHRGGPMTRGPPPRGGRPMQARGFSDGSRFSGPARPYAPPSGDHYCDSCERGFMNLQELQNHQQNDHVICGLEGCTLSAHPKIVEKHQRMQHESGLYSRLAATSSQNPEDVQKWIAERKKNFPTKKNIERRKQEEEECLKRGESLGLRRGSRFGRPRGGLKHRGRDFGERSRSWHDSGHRGGRGFGRGMHKRRFDGRGGRHQRQIRGRRMKKMPMDRRIAYGMDDEPRDVPMFPGTAYLLGVPLDKTPSSDEEPGDVVGTFSDVEWSEEKKEKEEAASAGTEKAKTVDSSDVKEGIAIKSSEITLTNALGTLMGTYASDDSDEDAPPVQLKIQNKKEGIPSSDEPKIVQGEGTENEGEPVAGQNPTQEEKPSISVDNVASEVAAKPVDEAGSGEESDGSAPEEVAIVREQEEGKGSDGLAEGQEEGVGKKEIEGAEREDEGVKRTRRGRKRTRGKGNSEVAKGEEEGPSEEKPPVSQVKKPREQGYELPPRNPTLLEELLKSEIRHERNVILQCIRYIVQRNFFDPAPVVHAKEENATDSIVDELLPAVDDNIATVSDISSESAVQ